MLGAQDKAVFTPKSVVTKIPARQLAPSYYIRYLFAFVHEPDV